MDYLVLSADMELASLGLLVSGFLIGWATRYLPGKVSKLPEREPLQASPATTFVFPGNGPDRVYVRFQFADGRVEVRKLRSTELDLTLEWRGRVFEAGEWTPDGQVYHEVVLG